MATTQSRTVWFPKDRLLFFGLTVPVWTIGGLAWGLTLSITNISSSDEEKELRFRNPCEWIGAAGEQRRVFFGCFSLFFPCVDLDSQGVGNRQPY
jgi:hypothetical protein